MLNYQKIILANDLPLIMVPMRGVESVTVLVGVGSGSRDESVSKAGLSHFLEHMAGKGTKKRPTPFEVASVIDSIGGEQNAGTSKEFTEYFAKVASPHLETAFEFLSDNLKNSIFAPREVEKERRVIVEEINMYEDLPMRHVLDVSELLLYGDNALGRDIAGNKKTVAGIGQKDFFDHLSKFYQAQNMVVVVAGKFQKRRAKRLMKKYFENFKKGKKPERKKITFVQKEARIKLVYKKTEQAHFCLGVQGVSYSHPDRFTALIIASILGYSQTSRIYRRIREEKGWAYYVHTMPEFYTDTGAIYTQAGVSLDKISESIDLVKKEYFWLTQGKVDDRELKRAKDYLKGRFILALEDSSNVASRYAIQAVVENKIRTPDEVLGLIDKVTSNDILRVSKKIFRSEKLNLAIIGPYKKSKKFQKLLA